MLPHAPREPHRSASIAASPSTAGTSSASWPSTRRTSAAGCSRSRRARTRGGTAATTSRVRRPATPPRGTPRRPSSATSRPAPASPRRRSTASSAPRRCSSSTTFAGGGRGHTRRSSRPAASCSPRSRDQPDQPRGHARLGRLVALHREVRRAAVRRGLRRRSTSRSQQHGNVQAAAAFLYGLAAEDLDITRALEAVDPDFHMLMTVRAVRAGRQVSGDAPNYCATHLSGRYA